MNGQTTLPASRSSRLAVRIDVNPNAFHDDDPELYVARFRDASEIPEVGDEVTVVQPDDDPDEPDYVSVAAIIDVDQANELITMRVNWKGFHDALPTPDQALQKLRMQFPAPARVSVSHTA
ncbi:MAG: hypothetical protein QOJ80_1743 [Mycobacterium sp.]|jgi:hypothetical protein|nr:hypothetical protein [Mycobacterium sp.]